MRHAILLAAALCWGCGNSTEPPAGAVRTQVLAGGDVTDSAFAEPTQALVVRVEGAPPGTVVRFVAQQNPSQPTMLFAEAGGSSFQPILGVATNPQGHAVARVKLGPLVGQVRAQIVVPEFGIVDSTHYTITPGAVASVSAAPRDTTLLPGRSVTMRVSTRDQYGNNRNDPVSLISLDPLLTVNGLTVTAVGEGVARLEARTTVSLVRDTTAVAIVPNGVLAAFGDNGLITFRTDGTILSRVAALAAGTADWSPDGGSVAADGGQSIRIFAGNNVRFPTGGSDFELYPEFSADGQWLYYARLGEGGYRIRRIHPDGTGDTLIVAQSSLDVAPSPSPDGRRLAYVVAGSDELRMFDLAQGTSVQFAPNGHTPAWSPTGDRLAYYRGGDVFVRDANGTNPRQVSTNVGIGLGIDWSPNGRWIVAQSGTLVLIEVATGSVIRLGFSAGWTAPTWRS